ncbi:unnamed protein product [Bursaphelenchus okinawaensis]|uniref:X-box-binding protein 1 n=1 Tax=Bursaphelenchus okinawaensis TaxID=465554 RepID=A0A811KCY6_9BILA|nr:unnamed protein product [Bursaphelenchus okinawaensis]CAG9101285.1 unnamed protein product [Bursaphelenchus okinawaensis]
MAKLYLIQPAVVAPVRINTHHKQMTKPVNDLLDDPLAVIKSQKNNNQPRRRERLTHLTAEEKLNRRKMKNREAAQNARDRKKEQNKQLEGVLRQMAAENKKLKAENAKLRAEVARLSGKEYTGTDGAKNMETYPIGSANGYVMDGTESPVYGLDGTEDYNVHSNELDVPCSPDSAYASSSTSALSPVSSNGYQPVVYQNRSKRTSMNLSSPSSSRSSFSHGYRTSEYNNINRNDGLNGAHSTPQPPPRSPYGTPSRSVVCPICRVCRTPDVPAAEQDERSARLPVPDESMVLEPFEEVSEYVDVYADDYSHDAAQLDELDLDGEGFEAGFEFGNEAGFRNGFEGEYGNKSGLEGEYGNRNGFEAGFDSPFDPIYPQTEAQKPVQNPPTDTFEGLPAFDDLVQSSFLDKLCSELEILPSQEENNYMNDFEMDNQNLFDWCNNV